MKFKKDIKWLIVNILGVTEINYSQLNFLERYFLKKASKKINKVKTKKNEPKNLRGLKVDLVTHDETGYIDWDKLKPKDL